jgi:hypothetical protein
VDKGEVVGPTTNNKNGMEVNDGTELADKGEVGGAAANKSDCTESADKVEVVGPATTNSDGRKVTDGMELVDKGEVVSASVNNSGKQGIGRLGQSCRRS